MTGLLKFHHYRLSPRPPFFTPLSLTSATPSFSLLTRHYNAPFPSLSFSSNLNFKPLLASTFHLSEQDEDEDEDEEAETGDLSAEFDDFSSGSGVYQKTLRLVECAMFAAVSGLVYLLSNSLAIENYFACFFSLPIVISSMRWGIAAGRKTMVATSILLLVLSGPVKALTYMLMHGLVGFTMGSLWRLQASWRLSILLCSLVRAVGALGYVLTSSFLIRENILALITINLLLNCGFFVFLLHVLYALFLSRLGFKASMKLPRWLENAL